MSIERTAKFGKAELLDVSEHKATRYDVTAHSTVLHIL